MQLPLVAEHGALQTLQSQLFDQIRSLILEGRMRPGTPMPATRTLAQQLGISRNTVMLAYERLITEGYLESRQAIGTFVSANLPEQSLRLPGGVPARLETPERHAGRHPIPFAGIRHPLVNPNRNRLAIDFWVGRPDARSFPTKLWRRLLSRRLGQAGSNLTEYGDPAGLLELRRAIADHIGPARGIAAAPEQVIIVAGVQEALNVVARLLVRPGSRAVTECPAYQGATNLLESYGATLVRVPVDGDGIDTARLPTGPVSLAYVTPSHQYPLGATLPLERRLQLLEWAWASGAYIVEDDYDSDFRYNGSPLTALTGLDRRGSAIYLGTFSKSVGAGIRLGYLVVPRELAEPAVTVKALLDNGHPWLNQAVLADFITGGTYANHLRRIRQTYMLRRDCLVQSLNEHFGAVRLTGLDGGMHVAWHLPPNFPPAAEIHQRALERGVGIYTLNGAASSECGRDILPGDVLMIGYSSTSEKQIREGIARIAAAIRERPN